MATPLTIKMNYLKLLRVIPFGILVDDELAEEGTKSCAKGNEGHTYNSEDSSGWESVVDEEKARRECGEVGQCVADIKIAEGVGKGQ